MSRLWPGPWRLDVFPAVTRFPAWHRNFIGPGGEYNLMAIAEHPTGQPPRFAIIGYAARLPGAEDADRFWEVLHSGRDAVSEVP